MNRSNYDGGFCFSDTLVAAVDGPKAICLLHEGDLVYSYDVKQKRFISTPCSKAFFTKMHAEIYRITFCDGLSVRTTYNQKFMTVTDNDLNVDYTELADLSLRTIVAEWGNGSLVPAGIVIDEIKCTNKQLDVWNIDVPKTHNFVVCDIDGTVGVVVRNCKR